MAEAGLAGQEAYTLDRPAGACGHAEGDRRPLHREIVKIVALPDVQKRLDDLGFEVVANSPDEFAAQIKTEMEKWAQGHPRRQDQDGWSTVGIRPVLKNEKGGLAPPFRISRTLVDSTIRPTRPTRSWRLERVVVARLRAFAGGASSSSPNRPNTLPPLLPLALADGFAGSRRACQPPPRW